MATSVLLRLGVCSRALFVGCAPGVQQLQQRNWLCRSGRRSGLLLLSRLKRTMAETAAGATETEPTEEIPQKGEEGRRIAGVLNSATKVAKSIVEAQGDHPDAVPAVAPEGEEEAVGELIDLGASAGGRYLFSNRVCPFAHRVWWVLHEKGLAGEFEYIHIDLSMGKGKKPSFYAREVNPFGTLPCIFVEGQPIYESRSICEYLQHVYPDRGVAVIPTDPAQAALVSAVACTFENSTVDYLYLTIMAPSEEVAQEKTARLLKGLRRINQLYEMQGEGDYFLGEEISYADICWCTFFHRFVHVLRAQRNLDLLADPTLHRLARTFEVAQQREAFTPTAITPEHALQIYNRYGRAK